MRTKEYLVLEEVVAIARQAGLETMKHYETVGQADGGSVVSKADGSPVTDADRRSHDVIFAGIARRWPEIPILSEEGRETPFPERRDWNQLWVVDPLDGTKEFIRGLDEFTVNIALVEEGRPILGVVYAPAQDILYSASRDSGSAVSIRGAASRPIRVRTSVPAQGLAVVTSRSHPSSELEEYLRPLAVAERISAGSSLKFCAVAEGRADLYPRLGPTMEWDTAAGQVIVECAGGEVVNLDGSPLAYNKESLVNPSFVARPRH
jgi:3'(2'), 5'-bisphosphate nucleotidase